MPIWQCSILALLGSYLIAFSRMATESLLCGGGHLLDLDLWHGGAGAAEVGDLGFGVLGVVVGDGGFDGVFSKHGAMHCKQLVIWS